MKATVQLIVIDMDMASKPGKQVWSWEVPVLQAKFGEGKVLLLEATEVDVDSLPDAREEYLRLSACHGLEKGNGGRNIPYVELAYGRGPAAIKALEQEINSSKPKPKKTASKKKAEPVQVGGFGEDDPLS